jgi:hypothetical protein
LLKDQRKPADSLPFEGDIHFDAVDDLVERNANVHPVVLAQRRLSFIFLNVADFEGIRRSQDCGRHRQILRLSDQSGFVAVGSG